MLKKLGSVMMIIIGLTSCTNATGYQKMSMQEALEKMAKETEYLIVDVRTQQEYDQGHIPEAILLPNESIDDTIIEKLPAKDQTIYIYCRSGNRSKQAANKLLKMGYKNVIDIGGINEWPNELAYD
ncbi:MAG: rhodanese-like domain-containing protein [Erysipelotrichaceae bacterium]|nr:rhodanese-like domain-containing protein [Erysipelotrichaceae bacterium]